MQHRNATVGEHDILFLWGLSVMVTILVADCKIYIDVGANGAACNGGVI